MIPFNKTIYLPKALQYIEDSILSGHISGDGKYTRYCTDWIKNRLHAQNVLLTSSCTAALEMSAILLGIQPGDEVIMPSYTFVSTANAFVIRGAHIIFVDIRPDTMNINEKKIEQAISEKTKAIVVVHYAGVACEMDTIMKISRKNNIPVVEDAAQGVMSFYKGRALGTIGDFGCYSFHETKNYTMGEGGALLVNNENYLERAEIIREKGTNRSRFFRGEIDKYSWVDIGSSYLPSDMNAAYLYGQFEIADEINEKRLAIWNLYDELLREYEKEEILDLPFIPKDCIHNAHMYYIKLKDIHVRKRVIDAMRQRGIHSVFHYIPLHSSEAGLKFGSFCGQDLYTTKESERLLRLPLYFELKEENIIDNVNIIIENIIN